MASVVHSPTGDVLKTERIYLAEFHVQIEESRLKRHPLARFQIQPLQGLNNLRSGRADGTVQGGGKAPPPCLQAGVRVTLSESRNPALLSNLGFRAQWTGLGVETCIPKAPGLQSARFAARINCIYRPPRARIKCH